jgi:hypothetical protein
MGPSSGMSPVESVRGMRHIAERFRLEDSGTFLRYDGVKLPWQGGSGPGREKMRDLRGDVKCNDIR